MQLEPWSSCRSMLHVEGSGSCAVASRGFGCTSCLHVPAYSGDPLEGDRTSRSYPRGPRWLRGVGTQPTVSERDVAGAGVVWAPPLGATAVESAVSHALAGCVLVSRQVHCRALA